MRSDSCHVMPVPPELLPARHLAAADARSVGLSPLDALPRDRVEVVAADPIREGW